MIGNFFNKIIDDNKKNELKCSLLTGIAKILIIQPFDLIRYRIQSSDYPVSINKIISSLVNKEGFKTFLMGIPATSIGVFLSSLIHLTLYQYFQKYFINKEFNKKISKSLNNLEIFRLIELNHSNVFECRDILEKNIQTKEKNKVNIIYNSKCYEIHIYKIIKICGIAGFISGLGLAIITTPIDNIRIKIQSVQNVEILEKAKYRYSNTLSCIILTYKIYGIKGFYQTFLISLTREGIASTVYFSSFEYLKNKEKIRNKSVYIEFYKSFIFGAIAGGINWIITFPIDTVKTKIISDSVIENKKLYFNTTDCVKKNFNKNGLKGFYSGFSIVFLRGLIVNGVFLSSYDLCREKLISNK